MAQPNRIAILAYIIAENTAKVDSYLDLKGLSTPSFDPETPVNLFMDPNITAARVALLNAMEELNALILGPLETVLNPASMPSINLIQRFKLTSSFLNEATSAEIAALYGLDEDQVKWIMHHAMS